MIRYIIYNKDMIEYIHEKQQLRILKISLGELLTLLSFMNKLDEDCIEY